MVLLAVQLWQEKCPYGLDQEDSEVRRCYSCFSPTCW